MFFLLNYCTKGLSRTLTPINPPLKGKWTNHYSTIIPCFLNTCKIIPNLSQTHKHSNHGRWTPSLLPPYSLPNIFLHKLDRVTDLFVDFDIDRYVLHPKINSLQHPSVTAHFLNAKLTRTNRVPMITLETWLALISIPVEWIGLITQRNQRPPIPLEF